MNDALTSIRINRINHLSYSPDLVPNDIFFSVTSMLVYLRENILWHIDYKETQFIIDTVHKLCKWHISKDINKHEV